jgi:hypothetical protein
MSLEHGFTIIKLPTRQVDPSNPNCSRRVGFTIIKLPTRQVDPSNPNCSRRVNLEAQLKP